MTRICLTSVASWGIEGQTWRPGRLWHSLYGWLDIQMLKKAGLGTGILQTYAWASEDLTP